MHSLNLPAVDHCISIAFELLYYGIGHYRQNVNLIYSHFDKHENYWIYWIRFFQCFERFYAIDLLLINNYLQKQ